VTPQAFAAEPLVRAGGAAADAEQQRWRDEIWALVIGAVDGALRTYYGVVAFTDDPACVLRIGLGEARHAIRLAEGAEIAEGEPIGALHFWNEQLPPFSHSGPDIRWAVEMHRRMTRSLTLLAAFVERDPVWRDVRAFRAEAALSSRIGSRQLSRVTRRYGFECVSEPSTLLRHLHEFGECFSAWGLARAYNPAALAHQRFFRPYHDLWISRATLIERYGHPGGARTRSARAAGEPASCRS